MILKGGLSMAQPGDHWLKKAMSLAWAKSSPALIYHSFLPHDTPCVCGPGNQHASQFGGKRGKESRKKEEDRDGAVEPVSLGATSPFPPPTPARAGVADTGITQVNYTLNLPLPGGIRSSAHWLIWSISVDLGQLSDSQAWRNCTSVWRKLKRFSIAAAPPVSLCLPTARRLWRSGARAGVRLSCRLGNFGQGGWVCGRWGFFGGGGL